MPRWVCPACEREFGRPHQSHVCVPGGTVDETFDRFPRWRPVYDEIVAHVATLGPVHADAVRVGVFLKRDRTLAEIRPRARALSLALVLPREVADPRVTRTIPLAEGRVAHVIPLHEVSDVDGTVRDWLAEAYLAAGAP